VGDLDAKLKVSEHAAAAFKVGRVRAYLSLLKGGGGESDKLKVSERAAAAFKVAFQDLGVGLKGPSWREREGVGDGPGSFEMRIRGIVVLSLSSTKMLWSAECLASDGARW